MVEAIVLNGGSSSGKSSLARSLQNRLGPTWLTLGVDDLIRALPGGETGFSGTHRVLNEGGAGGAPPFSAEPDLGRLEIDVHPAGLPAEASDRRDDGRDSFLGGRRRTADFAVDRQLARLCPERRLRRNVEH
jgi:Chloramphenicol phosphotransferase-like protein